MTAVAMKCLKPQILDDWQADREIQIADYDAECEAFRETVNGADLIGTQFFKGGFQVTGYKMKTYNEELPVGWRREANSWNAVPAKRTPEGKAIAKQLTTLSLADNDHPGVPNWLHCEGFSIFPSVEKIGDGWWLTMSKKPYDKDMEGFDSTIWAPAKLSEYYAAKEQA